MPTLPIAKMTLPSTLNGQKNGKLPDRLLARIGVGSARMEVTAARSFIAMFAEARRAGFDIREVGDYRTYEEQVNLFVSRYEPVSYARYAVTPSDRKKVWEGANERGFDSKYWIKKQINGSYPATAASPGSSNHGWGLALDVAEEYDKDSAPDPIRAAFVNWLIDNAREYGISAELQSEPWHWRYVAGDNIPAATMRFEKDGGKPNPNPSPDPTPGPAVVFAYPGKPLRLGSQGEAVKLIQRVVGAKPDGDYGAATERRVKAWQKDHGLDPDGVVGKNTWKKMFG